MLLLSDMPMENKNLMNRISSLRNFIPFVMVVLFLAACSQNQEQQTEVAAPEPVTPKEPVKDSLQLALEQVYQEVMVIHDRSMEQMPEIRRLSRQLNDSIENTGVNPMEQEETINRYRNHLKDLTDADQAMRVWMREFNVKEEELSREEKLEYLSREKEKIEGVDRRVNQAIREAREVLQK